MIAPDIPPYWRCMGCKHDRFAPSLLDERYCTPCATRRYAWRKVSIGRMRLVSPREAASWMEATDA